ncbi:MAG TPA: hypothetical protein VFI59_02830 [Actinomycetota bacterium]|nr:hypothetical protein [Actinomycetota bacterium]
MLKHQPAHVGDRLGGLPITQPRERGDGRAVYVLRCPDRIFVGLATAQSSVDRLERDLGLLAARRETEDDDAGIDVDPVERRVEDGQSSLPAKEEAIVHIRLADVIWQSIDGGAKRLEQGGMNSPSSNPPT